MSKQISAQELKRLLESDEVYAFFDIRERDKYELQENNTIYPLYLLDVRTEEEYKHIGHIPGAISIPGGQAIQNTDDVAPVREANIVFVCDNGTRSIITAYWYKQMGFNNVYVLDGELTYG